MYPRTLLNSPVYQIQRNKFHYMNVDNMLHHSRNYRAMINMMIFIVYYYL